MPRRSKDNSDATSRRRDTSSSKPRSRRGTARPSSIKSSSETKSDLRASKQTSSRILGAEKQDNERKKSSLKKDYKSRKVTADKIHFDTEDKETSSKSAMIPRKRASHAKKTAFSSPFKKAKSEDKKEAVSKRKDIVAKSPVKIEKKPDKKSENSMRKSAADRKNAALSRKKIEAPTQPRKNYVSREIRNNFIKLVAMIVVGVGAVIGIYFGIQAIMEKQIGFVDVETQEVIAPINTQVPRQRNEQNAEAVPEDVTPDPSVIRDISYGSRDIEFREKHINIPGIYDTELLFSAGSGSLYVGSDVLSNLYLYNLDTGEETLIAESDIYAGEYYETRVNNKWLAWLETDHGLKNYIMVMNRVTGKISKLQSFKEGQPKLNLFGDLLVWMEQVSDTEDRLSMLDLEVQEFLPIHTFTDKATYGVSSPYVYESTIVWADRDPTQTEEDKANGDKSAIYYLELETDETGAFSDPKYYAPGTYVHEPLYNGDVFVWLDSNKSPMSNLYVGRAGEAPEIIATGVTTYSIGDGIVVYGRDQAVWVYVIATKELCRLTSPDEKGMLPSVIKRTVVWYNLSVDSEKDVLRYKILTDDELYPGGLD